MNFNLQPTLTEELVSIRPLEPSDFDPLFEVAKDPALWDQHPAWDRYKPEVFKALFEDALQSKGALIIMDNKTNRVIGSSRFRWLGTGDAVEIGWTFLAKAYWGGTYNKAFKTLMINHALDSLDKVIFYIDSNNFRSQKATQKLGAFLLTKEDHSVLFRDKPEYQTYQISKQNWKKV